MASNDSREFAPVLAMLMSHVANQVLESFSPDERRALEQLTLREWSHFNRLLQRLMKLKVEFDHQHLATLLVHVRREAVSEQLQDELLRRGASFPLMRELVG